MEAEQREARRSRRVDTVPAPAIRPEYEPDPGRLFERLAELGRIGAAGTAHDGDPARIIQCEGEFVHPRLDRLNGRIWRIPPVETVAPFRGPCIAAALEIEAHDSSAIGKFLRNETHARSGIDSVANADLRLAREAPRREGHIMDMSAATARVGHEGKVEGPALSPALHRMEGHSHRVILAADERANLPVL